MAAPLLICFLLIASGGTAAGVNGAREHPHLELPGTPDSGRAHGSDAFLELPATPDLVPAHGSDAPPPQGRLMDIMSMSGCGGFAALVAATSNVSDIFEEHIAASGGGLTVFCPDDRIVAAFEPTFRASTDSDRVNVLLHHGAAGQYVRAKLAGFQWVTVPTLAAANAATNETQGFLLFVRDDTMRLAPSWPGDRVARVTKTISSSEAPLVLHVIDAVLLREKLDGAAKAAAVAAARGGYLGWLHCRVPLWAVLMLVVAGHAVHGGLAGAKLVG